MRYALRAASIAAALAALSTLAAAQDVTPVAPATPSQTTPGHPGAGSEKLDLDAAQQQKIIQGLSAERTQLPPAGFKAAVGAKVPSSVGLSPVPLRLSDQVPSTKDLSFAKLEDHHILLVDPKDRKVAEVINAPASTTGSSSSSK
jgi:hypothetical protein